LDDRGEAGGQVHAAQKTMEGRGWAIVFSPHRLCDAGHLSALRVKVKIICAMNPFRCRYHRPLGANECSGRHHPAFGFANSLDKGVRFSIFVQFLPA
jgi:hypothetical protein